MNEREKSEIENNLPLSRTSADYVRDNVITRSILKMFLENVRKLGKEELDEFEKVFMIVDKDLDLNKAHLNRKGQVDTAERVWESKGTGKTETVVDTFSLLSYLEESIIYTRSQMYSFDHY